MGRTAVLLMLAAALPGACRPEGEPMPGSGGIVEPPPGGFDYELYMGADGPMRGHIQGVPVEIERDLLLEDPAMARAIVREYRKDGIGAPLLLVRGGRMRVEDGRLWIGERDYGQVRPSTSVRVTSDGVRVGGESRGELPPREPPEGAPPAPGSGR